MKLPRDVLRELDQLIEKLAKRDPDVRAEALSRLIAFEQAGKIPLEAMQELAEDANPSMAMYGVMALGRNKSPAAAAKLIALLKKHRTDNRLFLETIIDALGETGQRAAGGVLLGLIGVQHGWWAKLLARLTGRVKEPTPEQVRERELLMLPVTRALARVADARAAEALGPFLEHDDPLVRWHVIQALQKAGVTEFNERLQTLAGEDDNDLVREAATLALAALSPLPQHLNN